MKTCPYCAEQIQDAAIKCRYCGSMLTGAPPPPTSPMASTDQLAQQVRTLLAEGQTIAAIKLVREQTSVGLRDAKQYVDAMASGGQPPRPVPAPSPAPGAPGSMTTAGRLKWVAALVGVLLLWWLIQGRHP